MTRSPAARATIQHVSMTSCSVAMSLVMKAPSSTYHMLGMLRSAPLNLYPSQIFLTVSCMMRSWNLDRVGDWLHPWKFPHAMSNVSVSPYAVSYRPLTLSYMALTVSVTSGLTPPHLSASHWISRTHDIKKVPQSRYALQHIVRSAAHSSFWHRMISDCSGHPLPFSFPAWDSGIAHLAASSYSAPNIHIVSLLPWLSTHRSRLLSTSAGSSPGFIASMATRSFHVGGKLFTRIHCWRSRQ